MPEETITSTGTKFESGKAHAAQAASELKAAAEEKAHQLRIAAEQKAADLRSRAEQAYGEASARARTMREEGEQYVRENPMRAVLTALGVGFVIGLIFRR